MAPYVQQSTSSWLALFFHRPPASILLLARRVTRWSAGFSRAGRRIWVEISASVNETSSHEGCFSSHQVLSARTATGDSDERLGKQGSGASSFRFFISIRRFHFALRGEFAFWSSWNIGVLVVTASVDNVLRIFLGNVALKFETKRRENWQPIRRKCRFFLFLRVESSP